MEGGRERKKEGEERGGQRRERGEKREENTYNIKNRQNPVM